MSSFKSFENISNLGKQSCNTIKTLSVVDRNGRFRFVHTGTHGGVNDRDQFTSSCLYTSQADYFTDEQFVVADGIYGGNGKTMVSYTAIELKRDPDGSRANFNTSITVQYIYTIFNLPFRSITESVLIVLQLCFTITTVDPIGYHKLLIGEVVSLRSIQTTTCELISIIGSAVSSSVNKTKASVSIYNRECLNSVTALLA